jgi:hypothetical protein
MNKYPKFPATPAVSAKWWPVQIEPIIGSGELITIGIAAISDDGNNLVSSILSETALICAFGENGKSFFNLAELCIASLNKFISENNVIENWNPPITGVIVGKQRDALGDDLESIVNIATQMTASFGRLAEKREEVLVADSIEEKTVIKDKFIKKVKQYVIKNRPEYSRNFGVKRKLIQGGMDICFDYFSNYYVANLSEITKFNSRSLNTMLGSTRQRLWVLEVLRETWTNIIPNERIELILKKPNINEIKNIMDSNPALFQEIVYELKEEAKSRQLNIYEVQSVSEASERIISMEDAA